MASEWREVSLWDVAHYINGRATKPSELCGRDGVPVIKIAELNRGITEQTDRIPTELVASEHWVEDGDLLFAWSGSVGIYRYHGPKAALNQHIFKVIAKPGFDQSFVHYLLLSRLPVFQSHVEDKKTTMGHVTVRDLQRIKVRVPPLPEQRAIAHILGTLDDKIELNRRMSETLEQMARALFKAWFVDFEPVRAKMEGRWKKAHPLPLGEDRWKTTHPLPLGEGRGEGVIPPDLLSFARELRRNATDAERLLWRLLRNRSLAGAKFRRQHPIPPYVLDFYCPELKLAIELDGGQHNEPKYRQRDTQRTARLEERHGIRVLRFWNREVLHETEAVLQVIYQAVMERRAELQPSPPTPLPVGEGSFLPAHLYDLFPDRLVPSELGEIPEGWEITALPEVIEVNPSRPLRKGQIAPYLDMANMPTRGHAPDDVVDRPFGSGMRFTNGDTLVARITPCLENGKTAFVDFLQDGQVGWGSTEYIVLHPKPPLPEEFAYCLARSDAFREFAIQSMTGTSGRQRVQADALVHFQLPRVPQPIAEAFGQAIKPLFARSSAAVSESRTLAALRDALLPKLISGELRVKDAERFLERVPL